MALKRPVTLAQARQWPAAARRRESFCARMGGMRKKRTGQDAAVDPGSPINRALAAWDCDKPEGLRREHVSKGIRMARGITPAMVGSAAKKKAAPKKNPAGSYTVRWRSAVTGRWQSSSSSTKAQAMREARALMAEGARDVSVSMFKAGRAEPVSVNPSRKPLRKPAPKANPDAMLYVVHRADAQGKPSYDIAKFRAKADAVQYAKAYAKSYSVPVVITGKKL